MARRSKYNTLEEARAVNNERSKNWYWQHREEVLAKQRLKYEQDKKNRQKVKDLEQEIKKLQEELKNGKQ